MMEYVESTLDSLKGATNSDAAFRTSADQIRREAELIAVIGQVLRQEGMDEADDEDYANLSQDMAKAALDVVAALDRGDADAARKSVAGITKSCDACHEQYR